MKKIYLAGPDVFRANALKHFEMLKTLCNKYGFEGLSPFDNDVNFDGELLSKKHSCHIFLGNIKQINNCDIIIANLVPFRGVCIDDGTAFEIGLGFAKEKLMYGYSEYCNMTMNEIIQFYFDITEGSDLKQSEFPIIESFEGNCVNLMIQESIELSGGKILKSFEDCLIDLKENYNL